MLSCIKKNSDHISPSALLTSLELRNFRSAENQSDGGRRIMLHGCPGKSKWKSVDEWERTRGGPVLRALLSILWIARMSMPRLRGWPPAFPPWTPWYRRYSLYFVGKENSVRTRPTTFWGDFAVNSAEYGAGNTGTGWHHKTHACCNGEP